MTSRQPPNTRVQRTRSSASPPHSPLTRSPLGRPIALALLLLLGFTPLQSAELPPPALEAIRESVFRYEMKECPWGEGGEGTVYFLSQGTNDDPSSELLARFSQERFPVEPVSASVRDSEGYFRDRSTGARGSIYAVAEIRHVSASEVEAHGSYCTNIAVFRLRLEKGQWRVVKERRIGRS